MHKVALQKPSFTLKTVNFFGALGYLSLFFEWLWVFGLLLYPYAKYINYMLPNDTPTPAPLFTIDSKLALAVGVVATAACLAITIYALYSVPRSIAKTGSRAAKATAKAFIPSIAHHKHISKKETKRLTFTMMCCIKIAATAVPLFAWLALPDYVELSKRIIGIVALFFAFWAFTNFGIQIIIAKTTKQDTEQVW